MLYVMDKHLEPPLIGPLYHGTRAGSAKKILREGFRRSRSRSYTGTGICLTESISIAYEYGSYETNGSVMEIWLSGSARWQDGTGAENLERTMDRDAYDAFFQASGFDAIRTYGGNVWILWNPHVAVRLRRLNHDEAVRLLCAEFDQEGPQYGYNGMSADYANVWWGQAESDTNLTRFPSHWRYIERTLQRAMGKTQSSRIERPVA